SVRRGRPRDRLPATALREANERAPTEGQRLPLPLHRRISRDSLESSPRLDPPTRLTDSPSSGEARRVDVEVEELRLVRLTVRVSDAVQRNEDLGPASGEVRSIHLVGVVSELETPGVGDGRAVVRDPANLEDRHTAVERRLPLAGRRVR